MANKRRILSVTLLIAISGAIAWFVLRPQDSEPIYQGKPLGYWLRGFDSGSPDEATLKAIEAVQKIGSNAVPTFLRLLKSKDSKFKLKLIQLTQKQHLINFKWRTARIRQFEAQLGFTFLGSQGQSAALALPEIYNECRSEPYDGAPRASAIAHIFSSIGPAAAAAIPQLVQFSTDTNTRIRLSAIKSLGEIHANPNLTVPVLTRSLRDPVDYIRGWAARGLAAFGRDAKSAVPDLIKCLADPSSNVAEEASSALKKIDPEAAAKAGVK